MVTTGLAKFGEEHQYGVVTAEDLLFLLVLSIESTLWRGDELRASKVRKIIRSVMPLLKPADLLLLAERIGEDITDVAWRDLSIDLEVEANKSRV